MSQTIVYRALKELGGVATAKQLRDYLKKKYPNERFYQNTYKRLKQLKAKYILAYNNKEKQFRIIDDNFLS